MKKSLIVFAGAALLSGIAFADTTPSDVAADKGAIKKDNADIGKQQNNVEVNRAEKEAAKANGNPIDQASQSVQIGANKAMIEEKKAEKKIDQKILHHDQKEMHEDAKEATDKK